MAAPTFVALDFETADSQADSVCAIGLAIVQRGTLVERLSWLVRPPRREMRFSYIHGIRWEDVEDAPPFPELWPRVAAHLASASFIAAHNAAFERRVLQACDQRWRLAMPSYRFVCTVQLARKQWRLPRARLPDVCRHLDIPLNHHDACSDAEASARIVLAAMREGAQVA